MPEVSNPLMFGSKSSWESRRTDHSSKCLACGWVFPGDYMAAADVVGGRCAECRRAKRRARGSGPIEGAEEECFTPAVVEVCPLTDRVILAGWTAIHRAARWLGLATLRL